MGSDKRNGRDDRSHRGSSNPRKRRLESPWLETLEDRRLLAGNWVATSTNVYDIVNGPMANVGGNLISIYRDYANYVNAGSQGAFTTPSSRYVQVSGTNVGVSVRGTGDFGTFQQSLRNLGMNITATSPTIRSVEGTIPIVNLYRLATSPQISGAEAILKPITRFQGIGNNQGDQSLRADIARTTYNVTGAGQTIGVLSDSVNQFNGGLATSISTGDLPGNVNVIQDGNAGDTDEGRAMLEQIYDIAPGANLAYATAGGGLASFAANIRALFNAGSRIIVDDIGYSNELAFQDSEVTDAVNEITARGGIYLSALGNVADGGYLSQFRGVDASVGTVGAGRYHNFDPTGATQTTSLGMIVTTPTLLALQFDQPRDAITSNLELYLLDGNGNIVYQTNTNEVATGTPYSPISDANGAFVEVAPGTYQVVVRVLSGNDPGNILVYNVGSGTNAFDRRFGSAGRTFYTTAFGHAAAANTISVGAVPFWATPPFSSSATINNEPFSSFGPTLVVYNFDGTPKTTQLLLKPDISATDGNNTSFFGTPFNTSTQQLPPWATFPGNTPTTFATPLTATNQTQANLPVFFGTSSAAPNLAAVVALIKQASPNLTKDQVLAALIATATPLNGAARGVWNPQGGYGLANATAAIQNVSGLTIASISPGAGQTITQVPYGITVTFSKPVNLSTLNSASIQFTAPNGATVTTGAPVGIDNATFPTVVRFPILINAAPGRIANGVYTIRIPGGTIRAQDGTALQNAFTDTFNLQVTLAPTVARTTFIGRIVTLTFAQAVNPASVTPASFYLFRSGGVNNALFNPAQVVVSNLPGARVTYDQMTWTATIDLTGVSQAQLPTDRYALVATTAITDQVGNPLNGQFNGVFPSGVNPSGSGTNFVQDLGVVALPAPIIASLVLNPATDSGIQGDSDTNNSRPSFIGQVTARFPNTNAGLMVYAQFNGVPHPGVATGGLNLGIGANGRGVVGQADVVTTTDANGRFVINYPAGLNILPEGQNVIRVVVVGAFDAPPAGLAAVRDTTFQIDRTLPYVGTLNGTSPITIGANQINQNVALNGLTNLSIAVVDPVNPTALTSPFAVNTQTQVPALNPATANNLSSYRLVQLLGNNQTIDRSSFLRNASFTSTSNRIVTSNPFTGRIDLTFATGLPQGNYSLFILGPSMTSANGVTDAVGNAITSSAANSATGNATPYVLNFTLQPTATYITNYGAYSADTAGNQYGVISMPRANYEQPLAGRTPGAPAPPTAFTLDFSNQLSEATAAALASQVILARSANPGSTLADGDFGNFGTPGGINNPNNYTQLAGINVQLVDSVSNAAPGQVGYRNRLFITLASGTSLAPDYYRIYLPNTGGRVITDIYGSQLDGEFLGYQNAAGKYVNQLNDGTVRGAGQFDAPSLSGDGVVGGAFVTGFVVVPNGNVIFARPDAIYNPQLPGTFPDGTQARPYSVLAPQATATPLNGGDLNSVINSGVNFNPIYDRAGLGSFQPSAFFAAQERVRLTQAPVVIVATPSFLTRDPFTGVVTKRPFVLQAPAGADPIINDASAAVPALTTLFFTQGSALKMQNAALLVQNQGSALQIQGGPNPSEIVNITSYKDATVGGATNGDASQAPASGDYGGILFRNISQQNRSTLYPGQIPITGNFFVDGRLKGQFTNPNDRNSQLDAVSGADPVMSYISFLVERYAGGSVPQTFGTNYDGITLQNSRPTIVNTTISLAGVGAAQAGLSADYNSLLQDDVAAGPLLRNVTFQDNGLNGIYIRGQVASGLAQATNATNQGGGFNNRYVINNPYPYLFTTRVSVGQRLQVESGGAQGFSNDRLSVAPGSILKFSRGAGVIVQSSASLNVGDTTYIRQFDNGTLDPFSSSFRANSAGLSNALFTSLNDDIATTTFNDPQSGAVRTVVAPLPSIGSGSTVLQPLPGNANVNPVVRWGGVTIVSGAIGVINSTIFRYGGGSINTQGGTGTQHVLEVGGFAGIGARISVTNNTFTDNLDVPINLQPDSLKAGDLTRPLTSGSPFLRGNVFQRNDINGVGVQGGTPGGVHPANLLFDSIWTGSDFTYVLRDTIVLGPTGGGVLPAPSSTEFVQIPKANVTLTLQSTLPGTRLADGTVVAAPGIPLLIKTLDAIDPNPEAAGVNPGANTTAYWQGGAGFIVGVDDGTDPPAANTFLIDNGAFSSIRILGIGANQSTGQVRVPVIMTSLRDSSVGTTVNGVVMNEAITGNTTAPAAGDGGLIYFGGNSLTSYNVTDLRSGSVIDNADIKFMTRIEQQGGGILYGLDVNADNSITPLDNPYAQKLGQPIAGNFSGQYNKAKALMISNSNLSTFSDGGVFAHAGFDFLPTAGLRLGGFRGQPTHLFVVNSTISGMQGGRGAGIEIVSQQGDTFVQGNGSAPSPSIAVILNSTFYNNATGINIVGQAGNGVNQLSHVAMLAMDSIFANNTGFAMQGAGQVYSSDSQYNLFFQNGGTVTGGIANSAPIEGDPAFRDPANGNFNLRPNSAAIDRARSELGPSLFGDILVPAATILRGNLNALPIRNDVGSINDVGGYTPAGPIFDSSAVVTLPGEPLSERTFPDRWVASLIANGPNVQVPADNIRDTTPGTVGTSFINLGTYSYTPLFGERDILGNLRVRIPGSPNVGVGTRPFFDLGAYEFIPQDPPVVVSVTAVSANGSNNLYVPNSIAGTNQNPQQIRVGIDERLNPGTITPSSVLLVGSGGDGVFGNANDINYNLNNRLSFDNNGNVLIINTAGLLPTGTGLNDQYRLTLSGTGSAIIRDTDGLALDGFTAGNTIALPSGTDNFPGSDFTVSFTIDTNPPTLVAGTFGLAPGSFTTAAATASPSPLGAPILRTRTPTFVGRITDIFPPANALAGAQVFVDISTSGFPDRFDILGAATGTTDANGNFTVTANQPLPDSAWTVGPDGKQGTSDDGGTSLARVRVIDQAGNVSLLPTASLQQFVNQGAAFGFQIDTVPPQVTALTPTSGTLATPTANGQVIVTATFSKNIDPASLNANSVQVFRAGGSGTFTGAGIAVPIVAGSFTISYLNTPKGAVRVTFALQGPLPNDFYRIVLRGTGTTPIRDIAGNALDGAGTGVAGSGDFTNLPFSVFAPGNSRLIYVDGPNNPSDLTATQGTRFNPFRTITAGIAAAQTGDVVLVLPGTYRERITLKAQVRVLSADPSSSNTFYLPGNARSTVIYGSTSTNSTFNPVAGGIVVTAQNIPTIPGVPTELSGFTVLAPLLGDSVRGTLDTSSVGIALNNANVSITKNYIINAGIGVNVATTGANVTGPMILSNVIAGNFSGVGISDQGSTTSYAMPTQIINNTIVNNTYGVYNVSSRPSVIQAILLNDIFYNNRDLTTARNGTGILSLAPFTLTVGTNLFFGNGANNQPASNASGLFDFFNPAFLTSRSDAYGNILGDPAFVAPRDPRPNGDTPAVFLLNANFDLTSRSPAINAALNSVAPATDILYRRPVAIAGRPTNAGPASIGAFYYLGTGAITATAGVPFTGPTTTPTTPVTTQGLGGLASGTLSTRSAAAAVNPMIGGSLPIGTGEFAVVNTSLNRDGAAVGRAGIATAIARPSSIEVNFSNDIDASSLAASDLVLAGSGLNPANPARATSLSWVDNHTVKFLLTGDFNPTGAVNLSIPGGAVKATDGDSIAAYAESFVLGSNPAASVATPTVTVSAPAVAVAPNSVAASAPPVQPVIVGLGSVFVPIQPVAVAGPIVVNYNASGPSSRTGTAKANAAATAKAAKKAEAAQAAAKAKAARQAAAARQALAKAQVKQGKATR